MHNGLLFTVVVICLSSSNHQFFHLEISSRLLQPESNPDYKTRQRSVIRCGYLKLKRFHNMKECKALIRADESESLIIDVSA